MSDTIASRAINKGIVDSPIGALSFTLEQEYVTHIQFLGPHQTTTNDELTSSFVKDKLAGYFNQQSTNLDLPYKLHGTPFQKKVWQAIKTIPRGQTKTYLDIAKILSSHPRAIGQALKRNPLPLIIPCHRVIAKEHIGGFSGQSCGQLIDIKQWLLDNERS